MLEIIDNLLMKNRTIVSNDINECMEIIKSKYPIKLHYFPTNNEYQTWPVPPEWNVIKAEIKNGSTIIASHDECPLFVARYSQSFRGVVSKQELIEHTFTNPDQPNAFCYEFRVAYDFQRRLKEWRIALPYNRLHSLPDGDYEVEIDVEVKPGNMIIGDYSHAGTSKFWFTFLAHHCHVGQANDGLAGVAIMLEVVNRIRKKYPNPRLGYKALLMPETIGSSIYVATHEQEIDSTIGAVFSEMGGAETPLQLVFSRLGDTYIDRIFIYVLNKLRKWPCRAVSFRNGWGNDELVFDSPGVGVPSMSLDRFPFEAYHTNNDNMELIKLDKLEEIIEILLEVVDTLEKDYIPKPINRVPPYMTRFNLYSDWTNERLQYDQNIILFDNLWSGLSVIDISMKYNIDAEIIFSYYSKLIDNGILKTDFVTPDYSRSKRFVPDITKDNLT